MFAPVPRSPAKPFLRKQIVGIDALRLLAAVLVLGSHLGISAWLPSRNGGISPTDAFAPLRPVFCYGWIGVEIFFVISGFVIAYSAQGVSALKFAQHRFFRLWPICVIAALVAAAATVWAYHWPHAIVWKSFFETVVFAPGMPGVDYIDDPFWTLPVEVSFYALVWALIATGRLRLLPRVLTIVGAISTLYWSFVTADPFWSGHLWTLVHKSLQHLSFYPCTLVLHGCFFATGVLLWDSLFRRQTPRHLAALTMCCAGCMMETWYHATIAAPYLQIAFPQWGAVLLWLLAVSAIGAAVRLNVPLQHALRERGNAVLRAMGLVTYPLYLLHNRLGFALTVKLHAALGWWPALAFAIACVVAAACLLALVVDPWIQRLLKRLTANHSVAVRRQNPQAPATHPGQPLHGTVGEPGF